MDITSAILDPELGSTTFTVERITYTRTRAGVNESVANAVAEGCIHPGNSEELILLPEEEKGNEFIVVYSGYALSTGTQEDPETSSYIGADRIHYNGQLWRVVKVKNWSHFGFCQACAVLMKEGE